MLENQSHEYNGQTVSTGIFKQVVTRKVNVSKFNIEGNQQTDLSVHGSVNKAVYAYPSEHYSFWKAERPDLDFEAGVFGKNPSVTKSNQALLRKAVNAPSLAEDWSVFFQ